MADLSSVVAGNTILASDLNQYFNALTAAALAPAIVASPATDGNPQDLALLGTYLLVACAGSGSGGGVDVFDLSNPASPSKIGYTADASAVGVGRIATLGRYAVTAGINNATTLHTWDFSDPLFPNNNVQASTWPAWSAGLLTMGPYIVYSRSSDGSLELIDYSNPAAPATLYTYSMAGAQGGITAAGGRFVWVSIPGSNDIQAIDLLPPTGTPQTAFNSASFNQPHGLCAFGERYLAVCNYGNGILTIVDASNHISPGVVTTVTVGTQPHRVVSFGRFLAVANAGGNSVSIVDVSVPGSPSVVQTITGLNSPAGLLVYGRYLYVSNSGNNTLSVIDLSGLDVAALRVGALHAGSLRARDEASVAGRLQARRLEVGPAGAFFDGAVGLPASTEIGGNGPMTAIGATGYKVAWGSHTFVSPSTNSTYSTGLFNTGLTTVLAAFTQSDQACVGNHSEALTSGGQINVVLSTGTNVSGDCHVAWLAIGS